MGGRFAKLAVFAAGTSMLLVAGVRAPAAEPEQALPFSVSGGFDVVTQYFFRGILQEDDGFIGQPWGELRFDLYEGGSGGPVNGISATFGWWNSLHSKHTGTDSDGPKVWYEADYYVSLAMGLFEQWEASVGYTLYNSPNSAFDDVQEVSVGLGWDDGSLWEGLGVSAPGFAGFGPSATLAFETKNAADGADEGVYLELGVEPGFHPISSGAVERLLLSFPLTVGLSLDNYYESPVSGHDDAFGYVDVGAKLTWPIGANCEVYGGVHLLLLGNSTEDFNDGHGRDSEVIGRFGVSFSF